MMRFSLSVVLRDDAVLTHGRKKRLIKGDERIECGFHRRDRNLHGGSRFWLLLVLRFASDNKMTSRMEIAFFYFASKRFDKRSFWSFTSESFNKEETLLDESLRTLFWHPRTAFVPLSAIALIIIFVFLPRVREVDLLSQMKDQDF